MRRLVVFAVLSALTGAALLAPTAVGALDYTDRPIEVSLEHMTDEEAFPNAVPDATLVGSDPGTCKELPSCDTLSLVLRVPVNAIYRLTITTYFEHVNPSGARGANDLDIFYWRGTLVKGEWEWKSMGSPSASAAQPERGKFADLPPTTDTNAYAIVVSTFHGSSPYTVKAEISIPKTPYAGAASQTARPRQISDPETTGAKPTESKKFEPGVLPLEELETVELLKVPGPDGPLVEHELTTAKAEAEKAKEANRTRLIVAVVALVAVGGALFLFFFFFKSRRATV